jgi:lipid A 4'-phosphatase
VKTGDAVTDVQALPHPVRVWRLEPPLVAGAAIALLCLLPGVDMVVSRPFFTAGLGFVWDHAGLMEFVRRAVPTIILGTLLFCVLLWVAGAALGEWFWNISTRPVVYLLTTVAVGPGLLVETLLKPHWGRARPKDITIFGGHAAYAPPFVISDECARNCSFVSGHAAIAFWVTAYAFLLPPRWREPALWGGIAFGFAVGLVRIMQGAHFASDVAVAGLIVVSVNLTLARLVLRDG